MEDYREKFLQAEKQATNLVEQLQKLKDEVINYRDASSSFSEVHASLSGLIERQNSIAEELHGVIDTLGKIDTSKILDDINELKQGVEEGLVNLEKSTDEKFSALDSKITEVISNSESTNKKMSGIQTINYVNTVVVVIALVLILIMVF